MLRPVYLTGLIPTLCSALLLAESFLFLFRAQLHSNEMLSATAVGSLHPSQKVCSTKYLEATGCRFASRLRLKDVHTTHPNY